MSETLEPTGLEERAARIRRLARTLVADPDDAEDLAQDAWVRALGRGPRDPLKWTAWLGTTVRNLARADWRGRKRREAREREAARPESQPSASEALERLDAFDFVVRAVRDLEEPYRSTVVARYFDGLTPREIASRAGASVKTVDSRLARGIEHLRRRLDRGPGGRSAWMRALSPLAVRSGAALTGVLAMNMKLKLALAALAVVGLFLTARMLEVASSPVDLVAAHSAPAADTPRSAGQHPGEGGSVGTSRTRAESEPGLVEPAGRRIALALRRFPDDAPLAVVSVAIEPVLERSGEGLYTTDESGRLELDLPADASSLCVRAVGFELLETALQPSARSLELALTPVLGLFGRVLQESGAPASGIDVVAETRSRTARYLNRATRDNPQVLVDELVTKLAVARTSPTGHFYLACETRLSGPPIRVVARSAEQWSTSTLVMLPRQPESLPDLRLTAARALLVRVVDEFGGPIAGAQLHSWDAGFRGSTRVDGTCSFVDPYLPAHLGVRAGGFRHLSTRRDGLEVAVSNAVEPGDRVVELVLSREPGRRVRVIDAETKLPITTDVRGRAELLFANERLGSSSFELDTAGESWIPMARDFRDEPLPGAPDSIVVSFHSPGYLQEQVEIVAPLAGMQAPLEFALVPDSKYAYFRGRVVRGGEPVAGLNIGLCAKRRSAGVEALGFDIVRGVSSADGRFVLRWPVRDESSAIAVYPHWKQWDEYGLLGPMGLEEATAREHTLELTPSVRVPAILRNVVRSDRYRYYVYLGDEGVELCTTINGAPLLVDSDGEARTTLLLPRDHKAIVTIGYTSEGYYQSRSSPAVHYDPATRSQPLTFEVESLFGRVSGCVVDFSAEEIPRLGVAFVRQGEQEARISRVDSLGRFEFPGVSLGGGRLLLFRDVDGHRAELLGRTSVHVEGNLDGITLARDPNSLPAEAPPNR